MTNLLALRKALRQSPHDVTLLLEYAKCCVDEWELEEARRTYDAVIKIEGSNTDAQIGLARVLISQGATSEAAVRLEKLIQENDRFAPAHLALARIFSSEGNFDLARRHYRHAKGVDPACVDPGLEQELASDSRSAKKGESEQGSEDVAGGFEPEWSPFSGDPEEEGPSDWVQQYSEGEETDDGFCLEDFEQPHFRYSDVAGLDDVKDLLLARIHLPTRHPSIFKAYDRSAGGSVLLYGPPGCGKTLLSMAVAGETATKLFSVGLHHIFDSDWVSCGKSLHELFEFARARTPAVLFFDHLDFIAVKRGGAKTSSMRALFHQFLGEMDPTSARNEGLLVICATNRPWLLDPVVFAPGRLERSIFLAPPSLDERRRIIDLIARRFPVRELDANRLADATPLFSGGEILSIFRRVAERALHQAVREGAVVPLTMEALIAEAGCIRPSSIAWFRSYREAVGSGKRAAYAAHLPDIQEFLGGAGDMLK